MTNIANVSNMLIRFNPETQMYDIYRVITYTCPCCGAHHGEREVHIKSITKEQHKQAVEKYQDIFNF